MSNQPRINANARESILGSKGFGFQIVGCAMEVMNELGHGLREKTYERALCAEFKFQGIDFSQQAVFPVF